MVVDCWLLVVGVLLLVAVGCWSVVVGLWLVVGGWVLGVSWSLVVGSC